MRSHALRSGLHIAAGPLTSVIEQGSASALRAAQGLWRRQPSAWSADPDTQTRIAQRLGWLGAPALMTQSLPRLVAAADDARAAGFEDVVLLGMGGSSLAPEVLRAVLGVRPNQPRFRMLDSTDPAAVNAVSVDPARTLFILASKSGSTIEPNSLAAYFQQRLQERGVSHWGAHFIAITDPGTVLEARARTERFRDLFINPADIGGRYSALSFFGLLPAALMGQPVADILAWGSAMADVSQSDAAAQSLDPGASLGLVMAAAAKAGRDKLTLVVPPLLEPFGLWVEQLVAESTGKKNLGVIPIAGETLGDARAYGHDRLFVRLRLAGQEPEAERDRALAALSAHPIVTIDMADPHAIGAEFMRWEIATSVAGALLGVNPFDEPNVQQAKDATRVLLARYESDGHLPAAAGAVRGADRADLTLSRAARTSLGGSPPESILSLLEERDYLSVLVYLHAEPSTADVLHRFRMAIRDTARVATMIGYGPRYLHSTGQLHKGGPNTGVFVLVTATPVADVDVPGERFSFGTLEQAQALGDFASLDAAGRRAIHIHLPSPDVAALRAALASLEHGRTTRYSS